MAMILKMFPLSLLVLIVVYSIFAAPAEGLAVGTPPMITSPDVRLPAISASISSLFDKLQPPSSITHQLTALPTSLLSALEGQDALSAWSELFSDIGFSGVTALPSGAKSWIFALPSVASTIIPQVNSLQSVAQYAPVTSTLTATPIQIPPPTSISQGQTEPATVTTTTTSSSNGLTKGQLLGAIVGSAAFAALAVVLGLMLYDARKRRLVARAQRANAAATRHASNAPLIPLASLRSHRKRPSDTATTGTGDIGFSEKDLDDSAYHGGQKREEVYELHSPNIGY